jgi:hypothetical protein
MSAHLIIEPEVANEMGVSSQGLAAMTLGHFCELAYYKGFDVRVSGFDCKEPPEEGSLTVKMCKEQRPIIFVSLG